MPLLWWFSDLGLFGALYLSSAKKKLEIDDSSCVTSKKSWSFRNNVVVGGNVYLNGRDNDTPTENPSQVQLLSFAF